MAARHIEVRVMMEYVPKKEQREGQCCNDTFHPELSENWEFTPYLFATQGSGREQSRFQSSGYLAEAFGPSYGQSLPREVALARLLTRSKYAILKISHNVSTKVQHAGGFSPLNNTKSRKGTRASVLRASDDDCQFQILGQSARGLFRFRAFHAFSGT